MTDNEKREPWDDGDYSGWVGPMQHPDFEAEFADDVPQIHFKTKQTPDGEWRATAWLGQHANADDGPDEETAKANAQAGLEKIIASSGL